MKTLLRGSLLGALLLSTVSVADDSKAALIGTVTDVASGKPLADVLVTATSPALQGEQVVVTDSQGNYRIPGLPPGAYTLRFEQEGFEVHERQEIQVRLPRTFRVDGAMSVAEVSLEEDAAGKLPVIDVGGTSTGVNLDQKFMKILSVKRPVGRARNLEALSHLSPGTDLRARTPSWVLSRQVVFVPDGTPQLVYRAPSADRDSSDFGGR